MSIIPILKSKELISILLKAGFKILRQTGSHVRFRHIYDATRQTTVPLHNSDVPRGLLITILRQAKISVKELLQLMRK